MITELERKARRVEAALISQCPFEFIAKALEAGATRHTTQKQLHIIIEKAAWVLGYTATRIDTSFPQKKHAHCTSEIALRDPDSSTSLRGSLTIVLDRGFARAWVSRPPAWDADA